MAEMADVELQSLISPPQDTAPIPPNQPGDLTNLLKTVCHNNHNALNHLLPQLNEEDFTRKIDHFDGQRNILTIACVDSNVSPDTFQILFGYAMENFNHLDFSEESWYYWEPIHFAAKNTDKDKLKIIVDAVGVNKLNALSIVSENALHVLMEYGRPIESFHVQLSNGWESRICQVIAQEKEEIVACARILIEAGIDVNHNNLWNETPIIIAIRYRLLQVIKLLLMNREVDLDTCKDGYTGKSARDLMREYEICVDLISANTMTISPAKTLFTFLKSGSEELFLRYNNENIRQYSNATDSDIPENHTSMSMLQVCLIKGFIEYDKERSTLQDHQDTDIMKTPMLKFFCRKGFGRSIEHLLNNYADMTQKTRNLNVFQMAVKLSYYPFLTVLLEHRSNQISEEHIFEVLKNTNESSFKSADCNVRHVLFLLISKLEMLYPSPGMELKNKHILNSILDLYLIYNGSGDVYKDNICQVLRLGASLNSERLERISYETLRSHLDECVSSTNDVCFDSLIRDESEATYSETEALHYLSHDPKKSDLLNHPALVYFIHVKWLKSSAFFYLNLALYSSFLLFLYWYMVLLQSNIVMLPVYIIFWILLGLVTLKECVQLLLYWQRYFYDFSNYLEVAIIVCCYINVIGKNEVAMVISILLSTLIFLSMLGQIPNFTKYMIIFSSTKYFLEYASFYFIQFVSFALCFFILLPSETKMDESPFGDVMAKLFDTLIFFIGQYDGDITNPPKFPVFGRAVVAIFIFCMTIILNNLLVGLIVTDMDSIQKTGKQQRQIKMIRYIARIEAFLRGSEKYSCGMLKLILGNTRVFRSGEQKVENIWKFPGVFDDDDKAALKEIHENRMHQKNVLKSLYEYINGELYSDHAVRDNRDILFKLSRLEEQLRRGKK